LRRIGGALIVNAEQRSVLSDPYRDEKLRRIAESSIDFILRKGSLSLIEQELAIHKAVADICEETRIKATNWQTWKDEMVFHIECRFEARYRYWEAEALQRASAGPATGTLSSAKSDRIEVTPISDS
jgi:hypothetical protein